MTLRVVGRKATKHFFPHIVVDFDLRTAIHKGLVKTIALDRRKRLLLCRLILRQSVMVGSGRAFARAKGDVAGRVDQVA